ncbi:Zinc transporter [Entomophthora muscae]|uniref:Zinc transporter n=1 Tax=Entomophthora muscae TaxID=34485 RepID=A0ACC2U3Z9_9FUNG|nr:Zinc transporter [Entomophthora muscae]
MAPSAIACPCSHDEQADQTLCLSPEADIFHSHDHTPRHSANQSVLDLHKHEMPSCSNERSALISKSLTPVTDYGSFECLKASTIPLRNSTIISNNRSSESSSDCECKFTPNLPVSLDEVWDKIPIKDMRRFSHISCSTSAKKATVITIEEPLALPSVKPRDVEEHNIMWSVGIQTAVAVGLHKLPEGLITVIGAGTSQKLGINLFIGIACHNFPEGFMLAIPIYAATGSALKAFTFAALIGGLTQPLGGLIGLALLDHVKHSDLATLNSVLFPLVAGIMLAVIVQSFIPAIRRQLSDSSSSPAIVCFFAGVGVMALLTSLFGHV